jgi:hypothetical protein
LTVRRLSPVNAAIVEAGKSTANSRTSRRIWASLKCERREYRFLPVFIDHFNALDALK